MAFENMAVKQPWHRKGGRVDKDGKGGVITHFSESNVNGVPHVHTLWVRLDGCTKPWPYNPNDIREA